MWDFARTSPVQDLAEGPALESALELALELAAESAQALAEGD